MKKLAVILSIAVLLLAGCASGADQGGDTSGPAALTVTVGEDQHTFTVEDLGALPSTEATFNEVAYKGVAITDLLDAVGVSLDSVKAIKAVATDGYAVNYDTAQALKDTVLVSYALADGSALIEDDGNFRMVLPEEEGKLNLRMLAELQIIQ